MSTVAENLKRVQERIRVAAARAGRRPEEITLVAVTKTQSAEQARAAFAAGIADLGENYVQEALQKRDALPAARWHLLGHLQTNKAKAAVQAFDLIQSADSLKLIHAIGRHGAALGKRQPILLQVHLGDEATKTGFAPAAVRDAAQEAGAAAGVDVQGLMGIAPNGVDPRPYFRQLRGLWDALPPSQRRILSLGMTGDFEAAIDEGATMVRIGTAIFGARTL